MAANLRSGIILGLLSGLLTLVFGGWSAVALGTMIGAGLGLMIGTRSTRQQARTLVQEVLPAAVVLAAILIGCAVVYRSVVAPAAGIDVLPPTTFLVICALTLILTLFSASLMAGIQSLADVPRRTASLAVLAAFVLVFPFFEQATQLNWLPKIIFALIFVLLALGLNIVVGYAGLLDLGYAAFFAIGAYTVGLLSSPQLGVHVNFWIVIWIAAAIAAIAGLVLGAPTLPLRGDYLAIVTLGFGEIVPVIFRNLTRVTISEPVTCWILPAIARLVGSQGPACITWLQDFNLTGGVQGINPIGQPALPFVGEFNNSKPIPWYFLIIALILLTIFLVNRLKGSRLGRAWVAMREDELAAASMGVDIVRTKLLAFAMGATFSGFGGAFYAAYITAIFPNVFDFSVSVIILCMVILGGLGNITGVILGGLIIMIADRLFLPELGLLLQQILRHTVLPSIADPGLQILVQTNADPSLYRFALFGLTLVIMMLVRPQGLVPSARRARELLGEENVPAEVRESPVEQELATGAASGRDFETPPVVQ